MEYRWKAIVDDMIIEKLSAIIQIGTKIKDFLKAAIRVGELERENKQLYQKVTKLEQSIKEKDQRMKDLETTITEQSQHVMKLEEAIKQPFKCSLDCPICFIPLEIDVPYQRVTGTHPKNRIPSTRTSRGTLEKEVVCPQCKNLFHVDFI